MFLYKHKYVSRITRGDIRSEEHGNILWWVCLMGTVSDFVLCQMLSLHIITQLTKVSGLKIKKMYRKCKITLKRVQLSH